MHKEQWEQETLIGHDLLPYGHGNLTKNKTHIDVKKKTQTKVIKGNQLEFRVKTDVDEEQKKTTEENGWC